MKKFITSALAIMMVFSALALQAQGLYRWEDKNGRVTYSDTPPPQDAKTQQKKKLGDNIIEQDSMSFSLKEAVRKNPVTLYVNDCGEPCSQARALLGKRGIPFNERDPSKDAKAGDALKALVGALDIPTMTVGETKIKGYLERDWTAALDSAGYPKSNSVLKAQATARAVSPEATKGDAKADMTKSPPEPVKATSAKK
jgi:Domain of unknown function (DUF4124)